MKTVGRIVVVMIMALAGTGFPAHVSINGYISGECITSDGMNPRFILNFRGDTSGSVKFPNFSDTTYPGGSGYYTSYNDSMLMGNPGQWQGTVIPYGTGFVFTPASRTYTSHQLVYSQSDQNYTAKDTQPPQITITPIASEVTVGNVINILSTVVDNSNMIVKLRYSLSCDSGKTFVPICSTSVPGIAGVKRTIYLVAIAGNAYSIKTLSCTLSVQASYCQIRVEAWDPDSNKSTGFSNIFSVKLPSTIRATPLILVPSCFSHAEKIFNLRGQVMDRMILSPFSLTRVVSINGQMMILKIK